AGDPDPHPAQGVRGGPGQGGRGPQGPGPAGPAGRRATGRRPGSVAELRRRDGHRRDLAPGPGRGGPHTRPCPGPPAAGQRRPQGTDQPGLHVSEPAPAATEATVEEVIRRRIGDALGGWYGSLETALPT